MTLHTTFMEEFGCSAEDAAIKIGNLRYDELSDFLHQLSRKVYADAAVDDARKRRRLAKNLTALAWELETAATTTDQIWEICKPYMQEDTP